MLVEPAYQAAVRFGMLSSIVGHAVPRRFAGGGCTVRPRGPGHGAEAASEISGTGSSAGRRQQGRGKAGQRQRGRREGTGDFIELEGTGRADAMRGQSESEAGRLGVSQAEGAEQRRCEDGTQYTRQDNQASGQ